MAQGAQVTAQVNGKSCTLPAGTTVEAVVRVLGSDPARVVVERNLEIVPRDAFTTTVVAEGDEIEVVQFVGGG